MSYRRNRIAEPMHQSRRLGRNYNSVSYTSAIKLGPVTHTVLVALMITVLGLIYLTQATKATSYDYRVQEIDSQIADLTVQKSDLEVENAKLTSIAAARSSTVASTMQAPAATSYAN